MLTPHKDYIDQTLGELSRHLLDRINTEVFKDDWILEANTVIQDVFKSPEVNQFRSNIIKMLKSLENDDDKKELNDYRDEVLKKIYKDIDDLYHSKLTDNRFEIFKQQLEKFKKNPTISSQDRSYDQVVKGNVKIIEVKKNNEYSHKIKFHKIGKFLQYQVFDPKGTVQIIHLPVHPGNESNHPQNFNDGQQYINENPDKVVTVDYQINNDRDVLLKNGKEWVAFFNNIPGFTPTTVMEIGYKKYIFVIKKAEINKNDKVVFYISTKEIEIDNKSDKTKKMKKIPTGKYKNVRFDIDYGQTTQACNNSVPSTTCWCPKGTVIATLSVDWIGLCQYTDCPAGYPYKHGVVCYAGCGSCNSVGLCCFDGCKGCGCKGEYLLPSIIWGDSDGYFCDATGKIGLGEADDTCPGTPLTPELQQQLADALLKAPQAEWEEIKKKYYRYPTCWRAGNNNDKCCIPNLTYSDTEAVPFYSSCCPPGSSC